MTFGRKNREDFAQLQRTHKITLDEIEEHFDIRSGDGDFTPKGRSLLNLRVTLNKTRCSPQTMLLLLNELETDSGNFPIILKARNQKFYMGQVYLLTPKRLLQRLIP